jgi:translation elongation factor EF-4
METLEQIKILTEELSVDATKFFKGNNSAGTRARQSAQKLKNLLQSLREEILNERKKEEK